MQEQNNDLFQDLRIWSKVKLWIHAKQTKMEFSWSDHTEHPRNAFVQKPEFTEWSIVLLLGMQKRNMI